VLVLCRDGLPVTHPGSNYIAATQPGVKPTTSRSQVQRSDSYTTKPWVIVLTNFFALSCNNEKSENPVLWPWHTTYNLEIQQGSCGCQGTCSCKISSNQVQSFMSYQHRKQTLLKTIMSSLPQTVTSQINSFLRKQKYTIKIKTAVTHLFKRQVIGELQSHHHHPGDPEEHDVTCSLQQVGRIKLQQVFSLNHKQTHAQ